MKWTTKINKPIIFSRSEAATWQICEMMYYFKYIRGYHQRSEDMSDPIKLGNIGHTLLQGFFTDIRNGLTKEEALKRIEPLGFTQQDLIALLLVRKFCSEFDTDSGKPIHVDDALIVPVADDLYYGFAPDLVWQYNSGESILYDWKFTRRKWTQAQIDMHQQLPGYKYVLNKFYNANIKHCRYVFFNTTSENKISWSYGNTSPDMIESKNVLDNLIKIAYRMKERKYLPVIEAEELSELAVDGKACAYCPYEFPCKLRRKGQPFEKSLQLMFTTETDYGYDDITIQEFPYVAGD